MIDKFGSEAQRRAYLPAMMTMERLSSYCLTEPNAGSDAASLETSAVLDGDEYVLNGSKAFISGAGDSSIYLVMARTGPAGSGAKGITCFVVDRDVCGEGIIFGAKERKMGWNSQPTRTVTFEECRVPASNVLGRVGGGFAIAMQGLVGGRVNIASCSLGAAQACLDRSIAYTTSRRQFGASLSDFQNVQFTLAGMATKLVSSRLLVRRAAALIDEGSPHATVYSAMAKAGATDACWQVCNAALQLHGGYGYLKDYPIEQFVRDCRVHQILEGTNEIMQVIIARHLLSDK